MRSELNSAKAELAQLKAQPVINPMDFSKGVVFQSAGRGFQEQRLSKYFEATIRILVAKLPTRNKAEPQKITIGILQHDYREADTFKKYMREMGVKDAWIVLYKDGVRVEIMMFSRALPRKKPAGKG